MDVEDDYSYTNAEKNEKCYEKIRRKKVTKTMDHLKVSRIMVKRTNLPRRGTTREVGGMISARRRKNTVRESRIEMDKDT